MNSIRRSIVVDARRVRRRSAGGRTCTATSSLGVGVPGWPSCRHRQRRRAGRVCRCAEPLPMTPNSDRVALRWSGGGTSAIRMTGRQRPVTLILPAAGGGGFRPRRCSFAGCGVARLKRIGLRAAAALVAGFQGPPASDRRRLQVPGLSGGRWSCLTHHPPSRRWVQPVPRRSWPAVAGSAAGAVADRLFSTTPSTCSTSRAIPVRVNRSRAVLRDPSR